MAYWMPGYHYTPGHLMIFLLSSPKRLFGEILDVLDGLSPDRCLNSSSYTPLLWDWEDSIRL